MSQILMRLTRRYALLKDRTGVNLQPLLLANLSKTSTIKGVFNPQPAICPGANFERNLENDGYILTYHRKDGGQFKLKKTKYAYLDLIKELALTDFKLKYQGSILGYLWSLAKPLALFMVLYFVFTRFIRLGSSIEHYPTYLLLGIVIWGFFTEITATSVDAIVGRGDLIRKVFFPRVVLVVSKGAASLITFSLNLFVVLTFIVITGVTVHAKALLVPFLILEIFILATGIALILSSLFVRFRDVSHIWEVALQIFFYATPILYPVSLVPPHLAKLLMLNPLAQMIQDSRFLLITKQSTTAWQVLSWKYVWIPYALPFIILAFGYWFFQKAAVKFAEEI